MPIARTAVPERENIKGEKEICEEVMEIKCPKISKDERPLFQRSQRVPSRSGKEKLTPRHITVKLEIPKRNKASETKQITTKPKKQIDSTCFLH